jgi:flagellar biosynthesis/type III secretory pathway protein FliH
MVAASGMELIKGSSIKETPDTPGFTRILSKQQQEESGEGEQFVRFMPDGSLSIFKKEKVETVPQIDVEEVNKRRLEQLEREVYKKAFEEGEKTGIEIGQEKMEQEIHRLIPQLEGVLRELDNLPHRVFVASENFLIESLLSFNRELLGHELTINPEGIADRVKRILDNCVGRKDIVIKVSPSNAKILERIEHFAKLEIIGDPSVASGSVVMESEFGGMEDNLEARLREVETAFRQQLQERLDQSGISDIADAAHQKAEIEKNAELTPLVEDQIESEPDEQAADTKDSLADEKDIPLESLADEDDTLDDFLDSVAQPESQDDQLDSKADDVLDDLLESSNENKSLDETDDALNDLLDNSDESQTDEADDGFFDDVDSSELALPPQDDSEWSALAEEGEDGDESDTFFEEEPSTHTDEDQTE